MSTRKISELALLGLIGTSLFGLTACSPDIPVESPVGESSSVASSASSECLALSPCFPNLLTFHTHTLDAASTHVACAASVL